jgi:hypothetical protein
MGTLIGILKELGFQVCNDGLLEEGFEKLAVYSINSGVEWDHVARQLPDGQWTSKIGSLLDITHAELESLTRLDQIPGYGEVAWFLKRPTAGERGKTEIDQTQA